MQPEIRIELTREVEIRSIHHLAHPSLTKEENEKLYGICHRPHGHHYKIRVTLKGEVDKKSGLLFDRDRFDTILKKEVVEKLDGVDLNTLFPNTSCEALALEIHKFLTPIFPGSSLVRIGIQETGKNYIEYPPERL